jgi:hypothetical protein
MGKGSGPLDLDKKTAMRMTSIEAGLILANKVDGSDGGGVGGGSETLTKAACILCHPDITSERKEQYVSISLELFPDIAFQQNAISLLQYITKFKTAVKDDVKFRHFNLKKKMLYVTGKDMKDFKFPTNMRRLFTSACTVSHKFYLEMFDILLDTHEFYYVVVRWLVPFALHLPTFKRVPVEIVPGHLKGENGGVLNLAFFYVAPELRPFLKEEVKSALHDYVDTPRDSAIGKRMTKNSKKAEKWDDITLPTAPTLTNYLPNVQIAKGSSSEMVYEISSKFYPEGYPARENDSLNTPVAARSSSLYDATTLAKRPEGTNILFHIIYYVSRIFLKPV